MSAPDKQGVPWWKNTPFPAHWIAYVFLKVVVIAAAVLITLYLSGLL